MTARTSIAAIAAAMALAACNRTDAPQDRYDISKMDLKPVPAKVSAVESLPREGVVLPFAEGKALSFGAELKALDPSPVKTVRLDTTHKVIEIAPGVKF